MDKNGASKMIRLTDEEIRQELAELPDTNLFLPSAYEESSIRWNEFVAKAQLKKVLREVEDYIERDLNWANEENEMLWKNKLRIWRQALLGEVEI